MEKGNGDFTHRNIAKKTSYESRLRLVEENKDLLERVTKDKLTQILNRDSTETYIEDLISKGQKFSIVMADFDNFKSVNDTHGHDAGDEVLKVVAKRIKQRISEDNGDIVGRWGGEEIVIVFKGIDDEDFAKKRAEEIRLSLLEKPIALDDGNKYVTQTLSMGVATYREGQKLENIIKIADNNCYLAKKYGRNMTISESEAIKYLIS